MTVGENIRRIRKEKGLTQKQLGELCGIAEANIRKYELGKANPKIETIDRIAVSLDVPIIQIKEDIKWSEHKNTEEIKRLDRHVTLFDGVIAAIENIYGSVEVKEVMGKTGWTRPYYVVGNGSDAFILYGDDIDAITESTRASIPILVEHLKNTRPEEEIIQEIINELNKIPSPE